MFKEFRTFIARGNVLDLAVGVIIGAGFGKIVTSLTESVIMPVLGWIFGDIDFSNWFIRLGPIPDSYQGSVTNYAALKEAGVAMIGYGDLITQGVNFVIIAFALFVLVRGINRVIDEAHHLRRREEAEAAAAAPPDPQIALLKDIREELRALRGSAEGSAEGLARHP